MLTKVYEDTNMCRSIFRVNKRDWENIKGYGFNSDLIMHQALQVLYHVHSCKHQSDRQLLVDHYTSVCRQLLIDNYTSVWQTVTHRPLYTSLREVTHRTLYISLQTVTHRQLYISLTDSYS